MSVRSRAPLLLLLAAAAAGPASAAPSTGRVTAELPDVSVSAPALLGVLGWAGLVEPALEPTQLAARFQALIGVDPLSAPSLREAGVDPSKPLSIVVDDARRQLLVEGTVVVEGAFRSGALTTAQWTGALHRPAMGVPGPVTSAASSALAAL